ALYPEASSYADDPRLTPIQAQARRHHADARSHFNADHFDEARIKAILSRNNSQKAIDTARSEETTRMEVRFYKVHGGVKVKRAGNLLWKAANINEPLRIGDAIKTASNGSAQIIYFEGSITTIKPGSLVVISNLVSDPETRAVQVTESLKVGGVQSAAFGSNPAGSVHQVTTENSVARAPTEKRSDFEVDFDTENGSTRVAVHEGEAELTAGDNSITLQPAQGISVAADGRFSAREAVLRAPRAMSPSDQKIILADASGSKGLDLVWSEVPGARAYRLEVARDPLMADLTEELDHSGPTTVRLDALPQGNWFWRVVAIDAHGQRGRYSPISEFRIASAEAAAISDREPPQLDLTDVLQTGNLVIISGRTDSDARLWVDSQRVDVYEDGTFTAVVRLHQDGRNLLEIVAQDPAGNETVARREAFLDVF
ncbi:MAG: hypothetical protein ACE5IK_09635, partial [Acidobacteriota bacterium]